MYKAITAGNLYDLQQKITGRKNCKIYIKPLAFYEITKLSHNEFKKLAADINARNLEILHEKKDGTIEKIIFKEEEEK